MLKSLKNIILDLRTYLVLRLKYPFRYPKSSIKSFVFPNTKIGDLVTIKESCYLLNTLEEIGDGTYIGNGTTIMECSKIGKYCSISHGVKIGLSNHALDHISTNPLFYDKNNGFVTETSFSEKEGKSTVIENDVLISANVLIMSGVKIGTGSVIGAGSFVNKDVAPYSIVAGTPAKEIKKRFHDDLIEKLLASKWWDLPIEELKTHQKEFKNPTRFLESISKKAQK